jgi:hypothetical protein
VKREVDQPSNLLFAFRRVKDTAPEQAGARDLRGGKAPLSPVLPHAVFAISLPSAGLAGLPYLQESIHSRQRPRTPGLYLLPPLKMKEGESCLLTIAISLLSPMKSWKS